MSLIRFAFTGSPTSTGTICVSPSITGKPASLSIVLSSAADACCPSRSTLEAFRWRTLASTPATSTGDRLVVKMKPGADIAAHHAERLAERALDDRQPVRDAFSLGNAAAARAVHADRMHFVEIGQRVIFVGEVADRGDRRDVGFHRIDALERDQLRHRRVFGRQQLFEVREVVMAEDPLLAAGVANAGDHRGVVQFVRKDHAAGQDLGERRQRRLVRHIAAGEQQCAFLAVQSTRVSVPSLFMGCSCIARAAVLPADKTGQGDRRVGHFVQGVGGRPASKSPVTPDVFRGTPGRGGMLQASSRPPRRRVDPGPSPG
ncbi:hypothetical protein WR25_22134 [Diploscapter pachys]|uniref:Uncharacterized protein n=1 Tax=Diploscapter pachys TaxID=2018661 RepID=A0A2A2KFJ2_9BILA|nr:hypothetical protein WR25_22134 [Diploscapter pachys]